MRRLALLAICVLISSGVRAAEPQTPAHEQEHPPVAKAGDQPEEPQFQWTPGEMTRYDVRVAPSASPDRLRPVPNYEHVNFPKLMRYRTRDDYPDYSRYYDGRGIEIPEGGSIPRSDAAIGIETGRITGGGCFPANPADPAAGCLTETDASGNSRTIWKEREKWTFRMSYIDPADPDAAEVLVGFPGQFGYFGDDELVWVFRTSTGRSCFTFYSYYCNTYGIDLYYIEGSVRGFQPSCANKRGPGYKAQIFYQYSRYKITDDIPPGANEWEPATVPATATRLEKPGKVHWARNWEMDMGENAISFGVGGQTHPAVEANTGYATAAPTVAPATGKVSFSAYDCGPIPGVSFSFSTDFIPASSGHAHTNPPSISDVANIAGSGGTTDANGQWSTTFTTGRVASKLRLTAIGTIEGRLFLKTADLDVGFRGLVDPGVDSSAIIRYTGNTGPVGSRHPSNHFGSGELHVFVRKMASYYNILAPASEKGTVGINDMSLERGGLFDIGGTWTPSHFRHRFGTDADIDRRVQRTDGTFIFADQDLLEDIVTTNLDGIFLRESGGRMHVQVPEYMVGDILLRGTR